MGSGKEVRGVGAVNGEKITEMGICEGVVMRM